MLGIFRKIKPKCLGVVTEADGTMRRCRAVRARNFGNGVFLCGVHHQQERSTYVRDWAHQARIGVTDAPAPEEVRALQERPVETYPAELPGEMTDGGLI